MFWARSRGLEAAATGTPTYDAFISYSHARDSKLAPAVQAALHRLARPWYRLRALRVFRDQTSLSADPSLWTSIERALGNSRFFILLASPTAASSKWVTQEVDYWRRHRPHTHLLIVLTDGEIAWDDESGDFDWDSTTALPVSMRGIFPSVPHFVDLRWARTEEHLSLADPRFRDHAADLAATIHGRPKDELVGEDVRQHRRTVRLVRSVIASLTTLTLLAGASALFAMGQRNDARAQRDLAVERERVATSGKLAGQAISNLDTRLDRSLLLSVQALRVHDTPEARDALLRALQRQPHLEAFLRVDSRATRAVAFSPDGATLATVDVEGSLTLWDVEHHQPRGKTLSVGDVRELAFVDRTTVVAVGDEKLAFWDVRNGRHHAKPLPSGRVASRNAAPQRSFIFSADGATLAEVNDQTITVWDMRDGQPRGKPWPISLPADAEGLAVGPAGRTVAASYPDGSIVVWDARSAGSAKRFVISTPNGAAKLAFSANGETLASSDENGGIMLWDLQSREALNEEPLAGPRQSEERLGGPRQSVWDLALAADGRTVASASARDDKNSEGSEREEGALLLWNVQDYSDFAIEFPESELPHTTMSETRALSPDGQTLAVAAPGSRRVVVSDAESGRTRDELPLPGEPASLAVSPHGTMLATSFFEEGGPITLLDVDSGAERVLGNHGDRIFALAFSPDGTKLASAGFDRRILLWDLRTGAREHFDRHDNEIASLAFSPDGMMFAAGDYTGRVLLWDLPSRIRLGEPFVAHRISAVTGLTFKQYDHGLRMFSRDRDSTHAFLWEIDWTGWKERACTLANRNLSQAEWNQFIQPDQPRERTCPTLPAG